MIIKFEVEEAKHEVEGTGGAGVKTSITARVIRPRWIFVDDLHNVEVRDADREAVPPQDGYRFFYLVVNRDTNTANRVWIEAKRSDGSEVCIVSERSIYLLNDEGRTIERLN